MGGGPYCKFGLKSLLTPALDTEQQSVCIYPTFTHRSWSQTAHTALMRINFLALFLEGMNLFPLKQHLSTVLEII